MIKEVDVDGDGKIDFYEFVHSLGEPENSQDDDDDDGEDAVCLIGSSLNVPSVTTSEAELKQVKVTVCEDPPVGLSKRRSLSESLNYSTTQLNTPNSRSASRRGSRSASPDSASLQKPFGGNIYDRARSPSLKEPVSSSFLSSNIDVPRRPSLRSTLVSEEVAMISRASFRESYNAMVKPKDKVSTEVQPIDNQIGLNLNIPELEALRVSYRALAGLGDQMNEQSNFSESGRRRSSHTLKVLQGGGRDFATESFDLDDDVADDGLVDSEDLDMISPKLTYRPVPGFSDSAFYLSRDDLQHSVKCSDVT